MKIFGTFLACLVLSLGPAWPSSIAVLAGSPPASIGGFGSTSILDNFNRSDENPLSGGGNWAQMGATVNYYNRPEIATNVVRDDADNTGLNGTYWTPSSPGANCEAYATLSTKPADGSNVVLFARIQNAAIDNIDCYAVEFAAFSGTDTIKIYRYDDDTPTQLGATINQELSTGDSIGIECIGSTIKAYYKIGAGAWTEAGSRTDSTYSGAGRVGLGGSNNATWRLDNFGGGNR